MSSNAEEKENGGGGGLDLNEETTGATAHSAQDADVDNEGSSIADKLDFGDDEAQDGEVLSPLGSPAESVIRETFSPDGLASSPRDSFAEKRSADETSSVPDDSPSVQVIDLLMRL